MNEDTQESTFLREVESLTDLVEKEFSEREVEKINKLCYLISKPGMSLKEACILNRIDYDQFQALIDTNDLVRRLIILKELEYKRDLLKTLSDKARGGDDKLAQWLLERRYPEEYARGKRAREDTGDMMQDTMTFLQDHGDKDSLVKPLNGKPIVVNKEGDKTLIKKLKDILK